MTKKVVRYSDIAQPHVGQPAYVQPIDHPDVPAGCWTYTTRVVVISQLRGRPIVETANTLYVPGHVEDDDLLVISKGVADAQPA